MVQWIHAVAAAVAAGLLVILLIVFVWKWCFFKKSRELDQIQTSLENQQVRIPKTHQRSPYHPPELDGKNARGNPPLFRPWVCPQPLFNWADHPSLVTDAVENGWSRFGFTGYMSSASTRSPLLGICSVGDHRREDEVEIIWEICDESSDFMQKIRINPGLKRFNISNASLAASSVLRTALPLPGPYLGTISFPQEAFFEIKILYSYDDAYESINGKAKEGERTRLIQQKSDGKADSESSVHVSSTSKFEASKTGSKSGTKVEVVKLSIGLTSGGSLPLKLPGSYPGSIGFNSDGSVYLDGIKLVFESEKDKWGRTDKVIGCGFDPRKKKVFFTVDSELMHEVHCKSEEFGFPLYPTLAANTDIVVLVNFGQSPFKYAPANTQRTPNPCFTNTANTPAGSLGYEDSRELFSMGRIDSRWLDRSTTKDSHSTATTIRLKDFDDESDADFFEIALESSGKTPKISS